MKGKGTTDAIFIVRKTDAEA